MWVSGQGTTMHIVTRPALAPIRMAGPYFSIVFGCCVASSVIIRAKTRHHWIYLYTVACDYDVSRWPILSSVYWAIHTRGIILEESDSYTGYTCTTCKYVDLFVHVLYLPLNTKAIPPTTIMTTFLISQTGNCYHCSAKRTLDYDMVLASEIADANDDFTACNVSLHRWSLMTL